MQVTHSLRNVGTSNAVLWLLKLGTATILFDCPLVQLGELNAYELNEWADADIASVDIILLSNHGSFLALPWITENDKFKGVIYASDPAALFGKLRMEQFVRSLPKIRNNSDGSMRRCYPLRDVHSCLSKIQRVRCNEIIDLGHVSFTALSSGYALGSANWMITYHFQKILYLSTSCLIPNKHASALDFPPHLAADFVFTSNHPTLNSLSTSDAPNNFQRQAKIIYTHLARSLETGGAVAFLSKPFGSFFDLLELVEHVFASRGVTATVHVVSGAALEALKVCNVLGEWMNQERKDTVFQSKFPLGHGAMMESKRLFPHASMHTVFKESPQVIILDYADLDSDSFAAFFKWRNGGRCTYILTDSDSVDQIHAFHARSKSDNPFVYCPLDSRTSEPELAHMLQRIEPRLGVALSHPPSQFAFFNAIPLGRLCVLPPSQGGDDNVLKLPVDNERHAALISRSVAVKSEFVQIGNGIECAAVSGMLDLGYTSVLRNANVHEMRKHGSMHVRVFSVGVLQRVADAAVKQLKGVVENISPSGMVVNVDLGKIIFEQHRITFEAVDETILDDLWNWMLTVAEANSML